MKLNKLIVYLMTLISLVFLVFLSFYVYKNETTDMEKNFKNEVEERKKLLEMNISLKIEALRGIKNLFTGSLHVTSKEFSKVAKETLKLYKSIQAIEWIPVVSLEQKKTFEENRKQEYPQFFIKEKNKKGIFQKVKERNTYFPVSYIEPYLGNEKALGFDLGSNETRLKTILTAKKNNKTLSTDSIILVQNNKKAFLVFIPVYEMQLNLFYSKNSLKGFVLGVFVIEDILKIALKEKYQKDMGFDLLYKKNKNYFFKSNIKERNKFTYNTPLYSIPGQNLIIKGFPFKNYFNQNRSYLHYVVFLIGLIFIYISFKYILSILRYSEKMENEVKKRTKELEKSNFQLKELSIKDALTSIYNRRYFEEVLDTEFKKALREKSVLTVMMIDIDYFKLYNDTYGHIQGDKCLKAVAKCIKKSFLRPSDIVARYGGEEFIVLLSGDADLDYLCNKTIENIRNLKIEHNSSKIDNIITVSIGCYCARIVNKNDKTNLVDDADKLLYQAKENGRNQYIIKTNI